ncbi:helix-turn-helix domain-containing protein [Microbacterium horticulturae]|uniref:Helix-turn-helix domain-containing protein n=1 Tax=Microbacterium horticulturae TaxID=3028316 RepID=A0ABY8C2B0_9MICO|nr:helix-turn-helix domain-containing protein [Microbacterium sp. KACC 23027]WEG10430.1 helix-turn-helix domain-containing protein [Microbacterium sp. KACC 23027]
MEMPQTTAPKTRLMFIDEVAERLGRSTNQLRWMVGKGTAPKSAMIGGRRCWRESDVEAFIEEAFQ